MKKLLEEGYDAHYLKYPIYELEPTGEKINSILRSGGAQKVSEEELQTLFMQNRRDYESTLRKLLEEGRIVIAEDYTGTGIAWGHAKGLSLEFMEELNGGLLQEDFAILLTGKRDTRARESKHIHESNDLLMEKVNSILHLLAHKYSWHTVELQPAIPDTSAAIWQEVQNFLKNRPKT
jgi:thymidylate kinase